MKLLATLVALGIASVIPHESSLIVSGHVLDGNTKKGIAGASVVITGTRHGAITNAQGHYRLQLPAEFMHREITLQAQMVGYTTLSHRLKITRDSTTVDLILKHGPVALDALMVTGGKREMLSRVAAGSVVAIAPPPPPGYADPRWNTESYNRINENAFRSTSSEPLSTFSIDVDRASYSNIRRFIREGTLPPKDAVRIEEMINYFPYEYSRPRSADPFSVITDVGEAPWQPRHRLVRIGLQAERVELDKMPPNNLVFLIDVSGSMEPPNKLPLLKQSMRMLVNELRPIDRVAMVVYAGNAGLVLPSTPGSEKAKILEALESLEAGGSTAGGAGIRLAYKVAQQNHLENGNNRVILATDGDFNIGVSSDAEMVRLVEEKRKQGTFLTVLGFGMGNLKDSKLEQIADHGNGNYAYIDDLHEARKTLVTELGGTLLTVAKDVKIQVEFNPKRVSAYRLIGYENRVLANDDFDNDAKDAGEIGAGHSITALYEVVPFGVTGTIQMTERKLRYQQSPQNAQAAAGNELLFVKVRYKEPKSSTSKLLERAVHDRATSTSADLRFAASVAAFGMVLRNSEHRGNADYDMVLRLARESIGKDSEGYRSEFVKLVEQARALRAVAVDER
jgi:Ca-activated chloride channel family protein